MSQSPSASLFPPGNVFLKILGEGCIHQHIKAVHPCLSQSFLPLFVRCPEEKTNRNHQVTKENWNVLGGLFFDSEKHLHWNNIGVKHIQRQVKRVLKSFNEPLPEQKIT